MERNMENDTEAGNDHVYTGITTVDTKSPT